MESETSRHERAPESSGSFIRPRGSVPKPREDSAGSVIDGRSRGSHNTSHVTSRSGQSKSTDFSTGRQGRSSALAPECHLGAMFICLAVMAVAIYVYLYIQSFPIPHDPIVHTRIRSRQVNRAVVAIISDSLDCSIYVKQLQMKQVDHTMLLLHGMMCLYLTEPHSFAPDAGYSVSFHFQQSPVALADRYAQGYFDDTGGNCLQKQNGTRKEDCPLRVYMAHQFANASLQMNRFADSDIPSHMMTDLNKEYKDNYNRTFSLFARFSDSGPNPKYPQALDTKHYNTTDSGEANHRVLRVSPLLAKMSKKYPKKLANWLTMIFGAGDKPPITTSTGLKVTKDVARDLVHHYFYTDRSRENYEGELNEVRISVSQKTTTEYVVTWPKGDATSSVISAFIIKTVYKFMTSLKLPDSPHKEALLYASFLVAQRQVYQLLPRTAEWNPIKNKQSLFEYQDDVVEVLEKLAEDPASASTEVAIPSDVVTRPRADRVGTMMRWSDLKGETAICLLNSALPRPFDSIHVADGKKPVKFAPFSQKGGGKSQPFSSAAAVTIFESFHTGTASSYIPRIVASASGSLRTIESVAFPVLRHLLLKEGPGEAVFAPTAFVSLLDGSIRCELGRQMKDGGMFAISKVMQLLKKNYKIDCQEVEDIFEQQDRAAYLIVREGKGRNRGKYLKAAVDERAPNFNYATGY